MTLSANDRVQTSTPLVETTEFTVADFDLFSLSDVSVFIDDVQTTAFTATGTVTGDRYTDVTITLQTAVVNQEVRIQGSRAVRRDDDIVSGPTFIDTLNADLDRKTAEIQEIDREAGQAVVFPRSEDVASFRTLPNAATRAGKVFTFGSTGEPELLNTAVDPISVSLGDAQALPSYITRASFVSAVALGSFDDVNVGTVVAANGLMYEKVASSSAISDLPNFEPLNDIYVQHFGDGDTALVQALTYAAGRPVSGAGLTIALGSEQTYTGDNYHLKDMHIDCTGGGRLLIDGGLTALPDLGVAIARGDRSVTFASAHGLSAGDVFCVYNPTALSFYDDGSSGNHAGDWFEVQSVTSTTVVAISEAALDPYAIADVDCYVMGGKGGVIENVSGTNAPNGVISLEVLCHKGIKEQNCSWAEATTPATPSIARNGPFYHMCFDGAIYAPSGSISEGTNSYARSLSHCKYFTVHGATLTSDWHAQSIGGGTGAGSVPNRFITVEGSHLRANGGVGAADVHSESDHVGYRNTNALQGIQLNGRNSFVDGCFVQGRTDAGYWAINGEPVGGHYRIKNTMIEIPVDVTSSFGAIDFTNLKSLSEDFILEIDEVTVRNYDTTTALRVVKLDVTDLAHSHAIKVKIGRLNVEGTAPLAVLSITGPVDVSSQLTVEIAEYHGPGAEYMVVTESANNDCTLSLPSQTMKVDASITTSVSTVTTGVLTYPCRYPRRPEVMGATFHKTDGTNYGPTMTTNHPVLFPFDVEENFVRGTLRSSNGANFNEAVDVQVVLTVGINDL